MGSTHGKYLAQSEPVWTASSGLHMIQLVNFPRESWGTAVSPRSPAESSGFRLWGLLSPPKLPSSFFTQASLPSSSSFSLHLSKIDPGI